MVLNVKSIMVEEICHYVPQQEFGRSHPQPPEKAERVNWMWKEAKI